MGRSWSVSLKAVAKRLWTGRICKLSGRWFMPAVISGAVLSAEIIFKIIKIIVAILPGMTKIGE